MASKPAIYCIEEWCADDVPAIIKKPIVVPSPVGPEQDGYGNIIMKQTTEYHWTHSTSAAALVRDGEGGTIVIVPGAMSDANGWAPFATALQTSRSVAIVNRRGRAPSAGKPCTCVAEEVADITELLADLDGPFTLVGWSYGGLLTLEAAIGRNDITSILLYEPVCRPFVPEAAEPIRQAVEAGDLDQAVTLVLTAIGGASSEQVDILRENPAWDYLKPLSVPAAEELSALNAHNPRFADYQMIVAPVTILIGELNENCEPYGAAANRFLDALPHAQKILIDGQGHLAHAEEPGQLANIAETAIDRMSA